MSLHKGCPKCGGTSFTGVYGKELQFELDPDTLTLINHSDNPQYDYNELFTLICDNCTSEVKDEDMDDLSIEFD